MDHGKNTEEKILSYVEQKMNEEIYEIKDTDTQYFRKDWSYRFICLIMIKSL